MRDGIKKYSVGEKVWLYCRSASGTENSAGWVEGVVLSTDRRMVEVKCFARVYDVNGNLHEDGILWCTHGSKKLRRSPSGEDNHL
jgi:hypothetical protein